MSAKRPLHFILQCTATVESTKLAPTTVTREPPAVGQSAVPDHVSLFKTSTPEVLDAHPPSDQRRGVLGEATQPFSIKATGFSPCSFPKLVHMVVAVTSQAVRSPTNAEALSKV